MKGHRLFSLLLSALVIVSMGMAAVPMSPASAGPAPSGQAQGTSGETLGYDPETGHLIFIGAPAGGAIASLAGDLSALSTEQQADSFVAAYGSAFGLSDPSQELVAQSSADGDQVTRYQQTYQGIPVFGGNLVVSTTPQGGLVAMAGKVSTELNVNVTPSISAESAAGNAQGLVAKIYELKPSQITAGTPALWIYDEKMFTESAFGPQLVWKVEVNVVGAPIREVVLVNAQYGKISQHYNEIDTAWVLNGKPGTRKSSEPQVSALAGGSPVWSIYTANNTDEDGGLVFPGDLVCDQTGTPSCGTDVGALDARDYTLDTYDFYWNNLGRDSIDDAGMEIKSTIHYGDPSTSPTWYNNAYWDGSQMVYGDRVAVDDVVAHELTHGVTEYTSGLLYLYQPGAINESMSDVMGELIDLSNVDDYYVNDITGRWLIGESVEGAAKAFRNMKNPPAFKNPDKMTSTLYYKGAGDYGGVHTNSGVNNKAAYLMTDGGIFNGQTVTGIGITKVAKLYYKVQTEYLFPGADYLDLYYALNGACNALVGTAGFIPADCVNVEKATKAVEMHIKPVTVTGPVVDACPAGTAESSTIFSEDFEDVTVEWDFTGTGTDIDFSTYPFGYSSVPLVPPSWSISEYPDSMGLGSALWGGGPAELNDYFGEVINWDLLRVFDDFAMEYAYEDATLANPLPTLPAGRQIYLTFDHMYMFETDGPTKNYDGGVLEYSDDGGSTWKDAKPLFNAGTNYNGAVVNYTDSAYQPLSAKQAFVANSLNGMLGMRYNLTSLAGQSDIKLRFRAGYDSYTDWGWFIDNVSVHTCIGTPTIPLLTAPAANALVTDFTPVFDWSDSTLPADLSYYIIQVATDNEFTYLVYPEDALPTSTFEPVGALSPNDTYYWRVGAFNAEDNFRGWSLPRSFRTAIMPPTLSAPLGFSTLDNKRPTFEWNHVADAVSYTVEASLANTFATKVVNATVPETANPTLVYTHTADLLPNKLYYWRVRANAAVGGNGPSGYSDVRQFTTGNPPSTPTLVAPAANALLTDLTPLLDWGNSTLPAPAGSTTFDHYNLQIADNSGFSTPITEAVGTLLTDSSFTPASDLAVNTTYYWRVNAENTAGNVSAWSLVRIFRTGIAAPGLVVPADLGILNTKRPTFEWGSVPGALTYTVEASLANTFATKVVNATVPATANPTVLYTHTADLLPNKLYYWRVRVVTATGGRAPGLYSDVWEFTTGNPPSTPTLVAPAANVLLTDLTPLFDWGNATLPLPLGSTTFDHYNLEWDYNSGFTSSSTEAVGTLLTDSSFTPALDFDVNTTYYWRVNAENTDGDVSAWSLVRSFRTAMQAPTQVAPDFTVTSPNPVLLNTKRPIFEWNSVPTALTYTLEASLANTFAVKAINATVPATVNPTVLYAHTADLLPNKLYYWRVRIATAAGGRAPGFYSDVWQFSTTNPPSVPALVAPAANALLTDLTPLLDWGNSTLPAPAGSTTFDHYNLQIADNSGFSTPITEAVGTLLTDSSFTPASDLAVNTTYYWRVNAENTAGDVSAWSLVRIFRTGIAAPALNLPLDVTVLNTKRPTFEWGSVPGALTYTVEASLANTFATKVVNATVPATANPTVVYTHTADLLPNKLYYWRVRVATATGGRAPGLYSDVWEFTTGNPPSIPTLVAPAANALMTSFTPVLDWANSTLPAPAGSTTFLRYNLQVDNNNDFSSPEIELTVGPTITDSTYTALGLAPKLTYYWRVNAENNDNDVSAWSAVRTFRTPLGIPVLNEPVLGSTTTTYRPIFEWNPVDGAVSYTIQVSTSPTFATFVVNLTPVGTATTFAPLANLPMGTIYWRVRANSAAGGNGPSPWASSSFNVVAP